MDLTDTNATIIVLCALVMFIGICGVVVPILPGLLLCWLSVLIWAIFAEGTAWDRWPVFAVVTTIALAGWLAKYALPGKRLTDSGVPKRSIIFGGLLGLVGFFVIPVVGLVAGFVLGIYLAEQTRHGNASAAWSSTKTALKAVGIAIMIELAAALLVAATWTAGLVISG
jgi:uncharacterized protein YqgC (DUF456 family)